MDSIYDTILIGAGQAGLATAYHLQQAKLNFAVLEADETIGGAWRNYYDSLELFSPARYSSLPGLAFPGDPDRHPQRDEVVDYLDAYAAEFDFPIITGAKVQQLSQEKGKFQLHLANRETFWSETVIVTTGSYKNPNVPQLPGQASFEGQIFHASDYRNPMPYAGQRIIVVGGGNTAVQIGVELAKLADVTIASRESLSYAPQGILGKDVHFWLTASGIDMLPLGQWFGFSVTEAVLDTGQYQAAIKQNHPNRRPMFTTFKKDGVVWEDGRFEKVDTVIYATGYRPHIPFLHDLDALDDTHRPQQKGGVSQTVPGLYFVGLPWQRSHRSATLRGVGPDAAYIVRQLLAYLQSIGTSASRAGAI